MLQQTFLSKDWKFWKKSLTLHINLKKKKKKLLTLANLLLHKLEISFEIYNNGKNSLRHLKFNAFNNWKTFLPHTSNFQWVEELSSTHFSNLKVGILNTSKNFLPNTFTLKLDTFKKLEEWIFHTWKISNTLKKFLPHLPLTWKWTPIPFVTL